LGRKPGQKVNEQIPEAKVAKVGEGLFFQRCKQTRHVARDYERGWQGKIDVRRGQEHKKEDRKNLSELVAQLCATQVQGQTFFYIPDRPSGNAREWINTTIVIVLKGEVTAKQIEYEFTRLMSGVWRWTTCRVTDNKFTVRFRIAQLIKD
jgi:hypothetical protein